MDMAARIGGDEFLAVLRDTTTPEGISMLAERLIRRIERPIPFEGRVCRVSASIGAVATTAYGSRPGADLMMADADAALYRAKKAGRATFAIHGRQAECLNREKRADDPRRG